jgi:antitoxin VapB
LAQNMPPRERLARERAERRAAADLVAQIRAFSEGVRKDYDTKPVTKEEWDRASGDEECCAI